MFRFSAAPHIQTAPHMLMILVPCVAVPLVLILITIIVCVCRKNKQYNSTHKPLGRGSKNQQPLEMNQVAKVPLTVTEFSLNAIRFHQELGEGAYGKVYRGELLGLHSDKSVTKVAVKTLKEGSAAKLQNDFRHEVELMSDLHHANIMCLLGVSLNQQPMCMLFELMSHGDLHQYLFKHSPHGSDLSQEDSGLSPADLLYICTQVGAGMEYLAAHHYVHRDLAARNVLVGESLAIKISDFGLSRDVYSCDYYRIEGKSLMPLRWMPPEAILYGRFSVDSDVWSFGVVLWEIYSFGLQPYYGFSNTEVIEMVRARQILPCPEDCPQRIYSLMVECWHEVASRRPTFKEMHSTMRQWRSEVLANHNPHMLGATSSNGGNSWQQGPHNNQSGPLNNLGGPLNNQSGRSSSTHTSQHSGSGGYAYPPPHHNYPAPNGGLPHIIDNPMNGYAPNHYSPTPQSQQQFHGYPNPMQSYQPASMHHYAPAPQPTYQQSSPQPHNQVIPPQAPLYKRPSPPPSTTSHKSANAESPDSINHSYPQPNSHINQYNQMVADNFQPPMYIPHQKLAEI